MDKDAPMLIVGWFCLKQNGYTLSKIGVNFSLLDKTKNLEIR